jgi:hypothetical protein
MDWYRGGVDHFPIFLEIAGASRKPTSPFKFNSAWLKEESFQKLVKEVWSPISHSKREVIQFTRNLKELKTTTKVWEKRRKQTERTRLNPHRSLLYNPYMTRSKEDIPIKYKKRLYYPWRKTKRVTTS